MCIEPNIDYLQPVYREKFGVDLRHFLDNEMNGALDLERLINWRIAGEESFDAYHKEYSAGTHMHRIQTPMFVYFTEDDPIVNARCIDHEGARKNNNIIVASNRFGAHLCSYEHFFTIKQFFYQPGFEFFSYFWNGRK